MDAIRLCLLSNKPRLFSLTKHRSGQSTVLPSLTCVPRVPRLPRGTTQQQSSKTQHTADKGFV